MSHAGGQSDDVLRVVHSHPGRVRLRSDAFVGGDAAAARAREALLSLGARRVEHDSRTGSLLVEVEPGTLAEDCIALCAAQAAGLRIATCDEARPELCHGERIVQACRRLNETTHRVTGDSFELRTLVPAVLAGCSAVSLAIGKGPVLPRWDNLAFWSISVFALLHGREINAILREPPGAGAVPAPRAPEPGR